MGAGLSGRNVVEPLRATELVCLEYGAAVIRRDEDMYVAECPEVGTASQGKTIEEAVKNLKEATELYLEEFPLKITDRSFITTFEVTEVAET